jgi:hypothetical protein
MSQWRKKPVVIEAVRFNGSSTHVGMIHHWMETGELLEPQITTQDMRPMPIKTLEGVMVASPGDWIIKGVNGEFYPCKPDIFEKTYERVE